MRCYSLAALELQLWSPECEPTVAEVHEAWVKTWTGCQSRKQVLWARPALRPCTKT